MPDWRKVKFFCHACQEWQGDVKHRNCPQDYDNSLLWLDMEDFKVACNSCNNSWQLEDTVFYCRSGHSQKVEYRDETIYLESGDQVIATDGDVVYILRRSGTLVVGHRRYLDTGYED